jgi:hypothetical protein
VDWGVAKGLGKGGRPGNPPLEEDLIPAGGTRFGRWWGRHGTALEPIPEEESQTPGSRPGRELGGHHPAEGKLASQQRKGQTPLTLGRTMRADSPSATLLEDDDEN